MSEYISVAATAKLVRHALKREFPGVKFSVRSTSYSGGSSVRVGWTDGPQAAAVDKAVEPCTEGGYRSRFIFTEREFSDEYRAELERAVVLLSWEPGPFDGNKRYEFGLLTEAEPAGRCYSDYGSTLVWQLSQADPSLLAAALAHTAANRAASATRRTGGTIAAVSPAGNHVVIAQYSHKGISEREAS